MDISHRRNLVYAYFDLKIRREVVTGHCSVLLVSFVLDCVVIVVTLCLSTLRGVPVGNCRWRNSTANSFVFRENLVT